MMLPSDGEAELRRIIDSAEEVTPEVPLTGSVKFSRIPARAAGMKLTATDWQVLHAIALHADRRGQAFPSLGRIALIAGILRNHVPRSIKHLEKFSLLKSWRVRQDSKWANTHYQLIFDEVVAEVDTLPTTNAPSRLKPSNGTVAPEVGPQATRVAPEMVSGSTSVGSTGGTSVGSKGGTRHGALTNHLTEVAKEEVIEKIKDRVAGGTSVGSTSSVLSRLRTQTTSPSLCPASQDGTGDIPPFASMVVE
jgi:hypothetical protein